MLIKTKFINIFFGFIFAFNVSYVYGADGLPNGDHEHPGAEPVNNCSVNPLTLANCTKNFNKEYEEWQKKKAAYDKYILDKNKSDSATDAQSMAINAINKEIHGLEKNVNNLRKTSRVLTTVGGIAAATGAILILIPATSLAGKILVASGLALNVLGQLLNSSASSKQEKVGKLQQQLATACSNLQSMTAQSIPAGCNNSGITGGGGGSYIDMSTPNSEVKFADMIDSKTQQCKADAPQYCASFVKSMQDNCKNQKMTSCMAALDKEVKKHKPNIKVNPDGTVTAKMNGKSMTFNEGTFESPQSMVKAGFTPAQAQAFFSPEEQKKREDLKQQMIKDMESAYGFDPLLDDYGYYDPEMTTTEIIVQTYSDQVPVQPTAAEAAALGRTPSSEVKTVGKETTIGTTKNDLFQMMKNRYQLKVHQSSFVEP